MAWFAWVLFESVAALATVLGLALFVLLAYWRRSGRPRPVLIGLATSLALFATQSLVVTQREHADRILTAIERDLSAGRIDALRAALAPDFAADGDGRERFVDDVRQALRQVRILWLERWELAVRAASSRQFDASVSYRAEVSAHDLEYTPRSGWLVTFRRSTAGWQIIELRCLHIDGAAGYRWRTAGSGP